MAYDAPDETNPSYFWEQVKGSDPGFFFPSFSLTRKNAYKNIPQERKTEKAMDFPWLVIY